MADKKIKPEALKGKSGGVMTAIMVVWLLALTGLIFMFMKASKESGLEDRITKLETKAATVVGKVRPADDTRDGALEARVNALEKRLSETQTMAAVGTAGGQAPAGAQPCNCEEMMSRLSRMESMILAKTDMVKELKKDVSAVPAATEAKTDEKEPVKPRAAQKKPRPKGTKQGPRSVLSKKSGESGPGYLGGDSSRNPYYDSRYGGETVFDITQRIDPNLTRSEGEAGNVDKLAPGAAIHPGSSIYYQGSSAYLGN